MDEQPGDAGAIRDLVQAAFAGAEHSSGTEADIVDALRRSGALSVSLVARQAGAILGHAAASPVAIAGAPAGWFGLGPVSVLPGRQRQGIGKSLVAAVLERLRSRDAAGCVVLGDPAYYARFGFEHDPSLTFLDIPPPYFRRLSFDGSRPAGPVTYHPAFLAGPD